MQLNGNTLAAVFKAQLKFVNFLYSSKKCHNQSYLNPVFNVDFKMGSARYVPFVSFKLLLKKQKILLL
jgi:hypothetical protein